MLSLYTLVVDRLDYTIRTIKGLEDNNTEDFVHFILSQGSNFKTSDWLAHYKFKHKTYVYQWDKNKGISIGSNFLLDEIANRMPQFCFSLTAKVDNDVDTITPNWLDRCAAIAKNYNILCSPLVRGLGMFPDGVPGYATQTMDGERIRLTHHIGGIVHMAKADLHLGHKYNPRMTMALDQDVTFTMHARQKYYLVGYLEDVEVMHMDSTEKQLLKYPGYFKRKKVWERVSYESKKG